MVRYVDAFIIGDPFCDKESIINSNLILIEKRELLQIELNKQGDKTVSIIMMNPSKADSDKSDTTVNKILEYFMKEPLTPVDEEDCTKFDDIKYVNILNLLPIYNPNNKELYSSVNTIISEISSEYMDSVLEANIKKIIEVSKVSNYVVLAWGMPENFPFPLYFEQASKVLSYIKSLEKEIYVFKMMSLKGTAYHMTKRFLNPPHPSKGQILGLIRVDVQTHYRIVPRI